MTVEQKQKSSKITHEQIMQVFECMSEDGMTFREACVHVGVKRSTCHDYTLKEPYIGHYARARKDFEDYWFEEITRISNEIIGEIIDDNGNTRLDSGWLQRQKLRIDAIKWMLAKTNPQRFGDKLDMTNDGAPFPAPIIMRHNPNDSAK